MTAQEAVNVYRMARFGNNDGLKKLLSVIFFFLRCTTLISTQDPSARDRAGLYDINATDDAGATALIYAARAGYVGVIKQLLAYGASATKEGYGGLAPLHHALIHLREPACHALLEAGADPNQADSGGHTALSIARRMGYSSIVALLEEHQK